MILREHHLGLAVLEHALYAKMYGYGINECGHDQEFRRSVTPKWLSSFSATILDFECEGAKASIWVDHTSQEDFAATVYRVIH
jgi:hypothetical protein